MGKDILYGQAWTPGIGDPTVMGWVTVLAYLLASILALGRMIRESRDDLCCWRAWKYLALILFVLAINKQLDLQSLFTHLLRQHALNNGWYEYRRPLQILFIIVMSITLPMIFFFNLPRLRDRWKDFAIPMFGLASLMVFVLLRASAFHNMDLFIEKEFYGIKMNWLLELGGIALIVFGIRYGKSTPQKGSSGFKDYYYHGQSDRLQ
jgi:hypothetical protein